MTTEEFIDLFMEELEIEGTTVTPNTKLASLGEWTSMGIMIAIGLAADNFDVVLKSNDLSDLNTVKDFMKKIGLEKFKE